MPTDQKRDLKAMSFKTILLFCTVLEVVISIKYLLAKKSKTLKTFLYITHNRMEDLLAYQLLNYLLYVVYINLIFFLFRYWNFTGKSLLDFSVFEIDKHMHNLINDYQIPNIISQHFVKNGRTFLSVVRMHVWNISNIQYIDG